jgi:hypothetical protein
MTFSALALATALAATASAPRVAVLDMQARAGAADVLLKSLTDAELVEVRRQFGAKSVVGTEDVREMLRFVDQKRKLGCTEVNCLVEIGGALGVERILSGTIDKVGSQTLLVFKLIDVRHAQVLAEGSADAREDDQLLTAVRSALHQLFDALEPDHPTSAPAAATAPAAKPEQPAPAGRNHVLAIALGVVAVAALGVCTWAWVAEGNVPYKVTQSQLDQSNVDIGVGIATGVAALGAGTAAVLTW